MLKECVRNFKEQLLFVPELAGTIDLTGIERIAVIGMGGSNLAPGLLQMRLPELGLIAHKDFGLPAEIEKRPESSLVIASSYSGNTRETIGALKKAMELGTKIVVVTAAGGEMLNIAVDHNLPVVRMPDIGPFPRAAVILSVLAIAKAIGLDEIINEISRSASGMSDFQAYDQAAQKIADEIEGRTPVIYSSSKNFPLGYIWKTNFNENSKIAAFCNFLPELNHNEMIGFLNGAKKFYPILLWDEEDIPEAQNKMTLTSNFFKKLNLPFGKVDVAGSNFWSRIFGNVITAELVSIFVAEKIGVDCEDNSILENFKKLS